MQTPHVPLNATKSVELFAIGNELLVGQVLDTNSHFLIRALTGIGAHVRRAAMLRDDYDEIGVELHAAVARAPRLIVTTGGLGPTDDDLTLRAISRAFARPLQEDAQALTWVRERYAHLASVRPNFDGALTASRRKMAQFPAGTQPIYNPSGAAPAMVFHAAEQVTIIALPGVPTEMKDIFTQSLQPVLAEIVGAGGYVERTLVLDLGDESRIAPVLQDAQTRHPAVYVKSRGQTFADGVRVLTVVLSCGGGDLAAVRADVDAVQADVTAGLMALGYAIARVVEA
jgi:nicotinamide-nucleotide amidase